MKKITKELYDNLEKNEIDINGEKLQYRGLMVFIDKEDRELEKAIEESGKIPYLIVTGDEIPEEIQEPESDPEEITEGLEDVGTTEEKGEVIAEKDENGNLQVDLQAMDKADLVEFGKLHFGLSLNVKDKKDILIGQINEAILKESGKVE